MGVREGEIMSLGLTDTNYYIEKINNKIDISPFYRTENYTQYFVINHNGKEYERVYTHTHTVVHQKLTQHCISTILQ